MNPCFFLRCGANSRFDISKHRGFLTTPETSSHPIDVRERGSHTNRDLELVSVPEDKSRAMGSNMRFWDQQSTTRRTLPSLSRVGTSFNIDVRTLGVSY